MKETCLLTKEEAPGGPIYITGQRSMNLSPVYRTSN